MTRAILVFAVICAFQSLAHARPTNVVTGLALPSTYMVVRAFVFCKAVESDRRPSAPSASLWLTRPTIMPSPFLPPPSLIPIRPRRSKNTNEKNLSTDANIHNFAPVARIMKTALPENAKIAKEAKECMQECVSEFISFITSEGKFSKSSL